MKVVFSDRAKLRLHQIRDYVAEDNPVAADRVLVRIRQTIELLSDFPKLGRRWQAGPTRALVISGLHYRVHYRLAQGEVQIITIAHTSQQMPALR